MFCYLEVACPNSDADSLVKVPASLFIAEESAGLKRPSLCYTVQFMPVSSPFETGHAPRKASGGFHSQLPSHSPRGRGSWLCQDCPLEDTLVQAVALLWWPQLSTRGKAMTFQP